LHKGFSNKSMAAELFAVGKQYPRLAAYEYMGRRRSFAAFERDIRLAARAFYALGVRHGDRVMLSLPNVPQAVTLFYALNLIGAVACMTHPLSSAEEMTELLASAKPRIFVTLYQFYDKFAAALSAANLDRIILTGPGDALAAPLAAALSLRDKKPPQTEKLLRYNDFLRRAAQVAAESYAHDGRGDDIAAVLYSGGTSGKTKGILLTNQNFDAQARLTAEAGDCLIPDTKFLAVMPVFHGFGLGVCVHMALLRGVTCLLVPRFTAESYAKLLRTSRPHYIAGVPTLFEALLRLPDTKTLNMSQMRGIFSGGDSMPIELKRRFDAFLAERGATIKVREGYGLTECVTACCLTPSDREREGSMGLPFREMMFKTVDSGKEYGEICISGPTVMAGYDNDPDETATTLRVHDDGRVWLHTGDLGEIDDDGYVYFKGRSKLMIVTSGYNVYPRQVEATLLRHEYVKECCVVGVPDDYRIELVKAHVVLETAAAQLPVDRVEAELRAYCAASLAPYNRPRAYEFPSSLPKTLVGKVAYSQLGK